MSKNSRAYRMRSARYRILLLLTFFVAGCGSALIKPVQRTLFSSSWTVSNSVSEPATSIVIPNAKVPGHVQHDVLLKLHGGSIGMLDSAAIGQCVQSTNETWTYSSALTVTEEMLRYRNVDIMFDGLDTYASVYINDSLVLNADNMFRQWRVSARPHLKFGLNNIKVVFHPVEPVGLRQMQSLPYKLPSGDPVQPAISPFVRKAPFQFGWDWSPRLLTAGIWRHVRLELYDGIRIANTHITVKEINDSVAWMNARVDLKVATSQSTVVLKINGAFKEFQTNGRDTTVDVSFRVLQPRLWWPNGSGEPYLHTFKLLAYAEGFLVDSSVVKTGIRTSRLVMEPDSMGTSFYFMVNERPVFIQGANYVPQSLLPGSVDDADRVRLLKDATSVGMNMLRVWGGGVYESDRFYEICDSLGLLVWQDFMFACAMYPSDSMFVENVRHEASYQVKRLSNHPSVILWCGNNESDVAWKNWGWQKQNGINATDSLEIINGYQKIFQQLLPGIIQQYDAGKSYIHSSPLSNWGKRQNFNRLNMHYWGVWHGEEPIDSFRVNVPRFMSEYGMQSLPDYNNLIVANDNKKIHLGDPVLNSIQKSYKGNGLLLKYIEDQYGPIQSAEQFCYLSQLHQADAMTMAIESHRMAIPKCMGTLYWQLNDVWNGASWSTIQADGKWKAAHHALKRLYGESLLAAKQPGNNLEIWFQRHAPENTQLKMVFQLRDLKGMIIREDSVMFFCLNQAPIKIKTMIRDTVLRGLNPTEVVWSGKVYSNNQIVAESSGFFVKPKDLKLQQGTPTIKSTKTADGTIRLEVTVNSFVTGLHINSNDDHGVFSNNYLTLFPGETQTLFFVPSRSGPQDIRFHASPLFENK